MTYSIIRNKPWQWLLIITLLSVFTLPAQAAIPDNIDYQGYLTDDLGSPITGTVNVTFSLYNVDTGGSALWNDTQAVTLTNGLFTVKLGGSGSPFPVGLFDAPLWLEIEVETDGVMTPRIEVSSTAFAFKADDALSLEGQSAASLDQSAHVSDTSNPHSVTVDQVDAVSSAKYILHTSDPDAHHTKTTTFPELTGQIADAQVPAAIARDSEIMPTVFANDGPGSGLNADLLDGLNSTAFMSSGTDNWVNITGDTMTGNLGVMANIGIGIAAPFYSLDVRGGLGNYLGYFNNDNNGTGSAYGLYASADARDTGTGLGRGAYFRGLGGSTSGTAYGSMHYAYAYGASTAYGVYSDADGGTTTGNEYAFYGLGEGYFSSDVKVNTTINVGSTNNVSILSSGIGNAGEIDMYDTDGTRTIRIAAAETTTQGAEILMYKADGTLSIQIDADFNGDGRIITDELQITGGADLSEQFDVIDISKELKTHAGMVVSIDPENPGKLQIASQAYDNKVAGIISGAGGIKPGMMMGQKDSEANGAMPVALTGRVYCLVDATTNPIKPGDLLTTSNMPGHAMKVTDHQRANGAIIGKAMSSLADGQGLVLVLVSLQ